MKYLLLSTLLSSVALFATSADKDKNEPVTHTRVKHAIPLYETYDNAGVNLGFRGDLLYMVYDVPVLTYASQRSVSTTGVLSSSIKNVHGKMSLGCDIGLMFTMHDAPGFTFSADWYHIKARFSHTNTGAGLLPSHSVALNNARGATGTGAVHAHLTFNFIDFLVKKRFSFGDWVALTPAGGLIGGWMMGKSTSNFTATSGFFNIPVLPLTTGVTAAELEYSTRFKGVGLKLGGCSAFKIWGGLRLMADLFYNVIWGYAKAHLNYSQNGLFGGLSGTSVSFAHHHGRPFFDSFLGLAWETRFNREELYLDIHAGWRVQTFSDGWKEFEAEFDDALHEQSLQGQGLEAGFTFRF